MKRSMLDRRVCVGLVAVLAGSVVGIGSVRGDEKPAGAEAKAPDGLVPPVVDLKKQATLYVVPYAHLDTEWRWAYPQTIREFVKNTLVDNFKLIDKYPSYVFNFSGSRRYQFMKEYYPGEYERLKGYIAKGRWFPCGSSVDENDANVPNAESYVRHVLYGNKYFQDEFGVVSEEYMLPDCFGFPASLPSLLTHCGLKGFSTQKLTWGLAIGQIPFKVGVWEGPDGRGIVSALDPGAYVGEVKENLANSQGWAKRIENNGKVSGGILTDYHYYGTGDQGGAPKESSVEMVEKATKTDGHIKVISGPADWMFKAITPQMAEKLPKYKGELELTEHSAGSISSQAYMKRWNRKNELLADAAEKAAVGAWWLGAGSYPGQRLEDAWYLVLGSQMHDILPGTSIPKAYEFAWNDEVLAANMFTDVLRRSVGSVSSALDTRGEGVALVVYNPLALERTDLVEATIPWTDADGTPSAVGPDGKSGPVQVIEKGAVSARVVFSARTPSAGFSVYHIVKGSASAAGSALKVAERTIENERYAVKVDDNGDVSSIFDKSITTVTVGKDAAGKETRKETVGKEMLTGSARLGLHYERPRDWPAWNQDWADRLKPARGFVGGPVKITVSEGGPVRGAIRIEREHEGSMFTQEIRLVAGGETVTFATNIDWTTRERSLRAHFPLRAANPLATYDIQTGVIERPNNNSKMYERSAHQWMDLTDTSGAFGASILNDCKYASDKPDDSTLRLTLLYTPGTRGSSYGDQATQDIGRHEMQYAFYSHGGDWREGKTAWQAARLNQPLMAFVSPKHEGALGKRVSLVECDNSNVMITAVKKAERSDEVIVRLRELSGKSAQGVKVKFGSAVMAAREVDGQEREIGKAKAAGSALLADVRGYGLAAYAVKLGAPSARVAPASSTPATLAYDVDVASTNASRGDGTMEDGRAYPAEQLPGELVVDNIKFVLGPTADGKNNAVTCAGQEIALPAGEFDRVEFLAAAGGDDVTATFGAGSASRKIKVQNWRGYIGQWDNRRWGGRVPEQAFQWNNPMEGLDPGYIKPDAVAWFATHHHAKAPRGEGMIDDHYKFSYLFRYAIDLAPGTKSVRLPNEKRIKVFAMTAVKGTHDRAMPAMALADTLAAHVQDPVRITAGADAKDSVLVKIEPRLYWRKGSIHYTIDGSEPTGNSEMYDGPFWMAKSATVKAAAFDTDEKAGPVATTKVDVDDRTGPSVKKAVAVFQSPRVRLEFSEPVDKAGAASAASYKLSPEAAKVTGVELSLDGCTAVLSLDKPLASEAPLTLTISGVKDRSPAGNALATASVQLSAQGPVYRLDAADAKTGGVTVQGVKKLPTRAGAPWTINMFARCDAQPTNRTILGGFGRCEQTTGCTARYIAKFAGGIHFWSHNCDLVGNTPLDLKKWQMLSATYDGQIVRLYKNGEKIAETAVALADDEPTVNVMPTDPWEHRLKFDGSLRDFAIWDSCLGPESLKSMFESFKAPE